MTIQADAQQRAIDPDKLMSFVFRAVDEVGATLNTALVVMGDKLGYYRTMADGAPITPASLAERTGTGEPYAREWLSAQAAGGYVTYDPQTRRYTLPAEHAVALADPTSPAYLPGFFQLAAGTVRDAPEVLGAATDGDGLGWHAHNGDVHHGCERFFRTMYNGHLLGEWLPALSGVVDKLSAGARVADVGCGHGASTILMAKAFPASTFVGSDYHAASIAVAQARAQEAGVADRVTFEVAPATGFTGTGFDLVAMFDSLHDMGDPVGAARYVRQAIAEDGTWMVVEPMAGDRVEDNLNPVGRAYYGFSTLLCTPASLSQDVGLALGTQAGPGAHPRRRDDRRVHVVRHRRAHAVQQRVRDPAVSPFTEKGDPEAGAAQTASVSHGLRATRPGSEPTAATSSASPAPVARAVHPSRAADPGVEGVVTRDGVRIAWSVYGNGHAPTVVLVPTWSIVPSRFWKAQVGYLSRHYRVVTFDGRGSGASSKPVGAAAYTDTEYAADLLAVLDATATEAAVLVSLSCGAAWSIHVAARHPSRVLGLVAIAPSCGLNVPTPGRDHVPWDVPLDSTDGWAKYNKHYWLGGGYDEFVEFFFGRMFSEPHSTKQVEDCVGWAHEITPQVLADTTAGRLGCDGAVCESIEPLARAVTCPVLVVHGSDDRIRPLAFGERLASLTRGTLVVLDGAGHGPPARDPVKVNHLIHGFVEQVATPSAAPVRAVPVRAVPVPAVPSGASAHATPAGDAPAARRTWTRALRRPQRALYLSSPIGLGHAQRDVAIARSLRELRPDLQVDWLAQHPVTRVLEQHGERVHPASAWLRNESGHVEHEAGEHDLHAFQAIRRMDEILVSNFMVCADVVASGDYDLVVGDEAWDVDYFLHENPELKRFAFAWLTDFVGWLPMPDGGATEAALTADYNAEMIAQRARFGRVRDRSVFVGSLDDVVDEPFGPDLPSIRSWTADNFSFAGYVTGFDPVAASADADSMRSSLGVRPDERLCVVTVGGSGVGAPLLHRVLDAVPAARALVPDLRFIVVAGPRIDPASLPAPDGATVLGYVPDLYRLSAACDVAVVQGGLTTCMELTALRKPFVYVPLQHHFEQTFHVRNRLDRYDAGRHLPYADALDPDALAEAVAKEVGREVAYRPVETDGAARAAALLADLV